MQAEIITIGDELLIGQVVDTNSTWLGRTLGEDGIKVTQITSVQDDADQIARAVNEALARVSIVLVTGGLGPTRDDITKHTLAELFGMRLVRDEQVYETVRRQLAVRGIAFNELNRGQALVRTAVRYCRTATVRPRECGSSAAGKYWCRCPAYRSK